MQQVEESAPKFFYFAKAYVRTGCAILACLACVGYVVQYFIALQSDPSLWGALIFLPVYLVILGGIGGGVGAMVGFIFAALRYSLIREKSISTR